MTVPAERVPGELMLLVTQLAWVTWVQQRKFKILSNPNNICRVEEDQTAAGRTTAERRAPKHRIDFLTEGFVACFWSKVT